MCWNKAVIVYVDLMFPSSRAGIREIRQVSCPIQIFGESRLNRTLSGHYVDPTTGRFHVGYLYSQEVPARSGAAAATTEDFVRYVDVFPEDPRFIEPGGINDPLAVFDGTVIAPGYKGLPTFIYVRPITTCILAAASSILPL